MALKKTAKPHRKFRVQFLLSGNKWVNSGSEDRVFTSIARAEAAAQYMAEHAWFAYRVVSIAPRSVKVVAMYGPGRK